MVKIKEIDTDDETEVEEISTVKHTNGKAEEDEGSNSEVDDDDGSDFDIDFTKSIPKEELTAFLNKPIPELVHAATVGDCCDHGGCDDDGDDQPADDDFFKDENSSSDSTSSLTSKRMITLMVMFPMIASGGFMMSEMIGNFKMGKSSMQATAVIGGAIIALIVMANVKALQSAVKFVVCFSWLLFLYPTYQVYHCSPVPLKNDMLGTWFSFKTQGPKFSELSYTTSECFRSFSFQSPYMLSAMSVKISLTVHINDLINLDVGEKSEKTTGESSAGEYNYFLLVSKRSVKKKFHKLYTLVETDDKMATTLRSALKLTSAEKDRKLLEVVGYVVDVEDALLPMKDELTGMGYLVRPVKFKTTNVKYIDRYAKLRN